MARRSRTQRSGRKARPPLLTAETEPFRQDWLLLSPGERLLRSWRMRSLLKDPGAAHDAQSLPHL